MKPTNIQENTLRKLFDGDHVQREQIISIQRPEMQGQLRDLMIAKKNSEQLFQILFSDLAFSSGEMKKNPDSQFWRRTTIRALTATIDGIIYCLKQMALTTGTMGEFPFTDKDKFFLSEDASQLREGTKPRLPPFRDNIKQTFKLFVKIYEISCPTDFGQDGFDALCDTYELRHRLIHPKSYMTFCVSDKERLRAGKATAWLDSEIRKLLDSASQNLAKK